MSGPTGSSTESRTGALGRDLLLVAALVAAPVLGALAGARGPQRLDLNLGPGDAAYVSGFTPEYEIDDKVATHWTTYAASVRLPLVVRGGPPDVSYRFARVLPETAVVDVSFGGQPVDHFTCRGGIVHERRVRSLAPLPAPVVLDFTIDSHDRRNLGLKLDWVRIDVPAEATVRLAGRARWRGVLAVALVAVILRLAGWTRAHTLLLGLPCAAAATFGLVRQPWMTYRLLTGVPETLALAGAVGLGVGWLAKARGHASREAVRIVTALGLAAFLLRALPLNHPDFYYPDLRTHARLVGVLQKAGLDFLRAPSQYIWEHGVWRTEAYGRTYAFPYTPAFHVPFAFTTFAYDDLLTALKLAAAAVSVAPLVLLWALARRLGASPLGALLMVLIPTYSSRLSFAFFPALFGHAVDMAFVYWLAGHLDRIRSPRTWVAGAGLVAACQLAYVSGVTNISLFVAALAVADSLGRTGERARHGLAILGMGLAGSLLSLALYYRDFLGMVVDLVPRVAGAAGSASRYPVQGWLAVAYARTRDFFDGVYPVLAAMGFTLLFRRGRGRGLLTAWAATYMLLLLGRAKVPDVFLHGHETLFVTPLVCLLAGEALSGLWARGGWGRLAAGGLVGILALQGFWLQWHALADQLGNAL